MRILLNIIIGAQVVLGLWWTVPLLFHEGDFSTLAVLFVSAIANAVFLLVAAWTMWKHPDLRRRAGVIIAMPFIMYLAPYIIKGVFGGPMTGSRGRNALILFGALAATACLFFPARIATLLPKGLLQSRALNWLLIVATAIAWVFPVAIVAWHAAGNGGSSTSGTALGYAIVYLAIYVVLVGGASILMMLWAWVGLRSGPENPSRKLHVAQLVMGSPSVLLGLLVLSWLAGQ